MGYIKLYVDRNGDGRLNSSEAVKKDTMVYYLERATGIVRILHTDNEGRVSMNHVHMGDKVYCRVLAYSHESPRGGVHNDISVFDLYMDTCRVVNGSSASTISIGHHIGFTLQQAAAINGGGTVEVALSHPVWSFNILAALDWNATHNELQDLEKGILSASNYLFHVSHGHMKIGKVRLYNNVPQTASLFTTNADLQLFGANTVWPWAGIDGWNNSASIKMWGTNPVAPHQSWWATLVHEMGHYFLGFSDEYYDGKGDVAAWSNYRAAHPDQVPDNYGLMDNNFVAPEISASNDYLGSYVNFTIDQVTAQIWHHIIKNGSPWTHRSCWEYLFDRFDNRMGNLNKWNGYNGLRAKILIPETGQFTGRNPDGTERRTVEDRQAPDQFFPLFFGTRKVWAEAQVAPYYYHPATNSFVLNPPLTLLPVQGVAVPVRIMVKDETGQPLSLVRIWKETDTGRIELGKTGRDGILQTFVCEKGDSILASLHGVMKKTKLSGDTLEIQFKTMEDKAAQLPGFILIPAIQQVMKGTTKAHDIHFRLVAGDTASEEPAIEIRPSFGNKTPLKLKPSVNGSFAATFTDENCALSGSFDIRIATKRGVLESTATYQVMHVPGVTDHPFAMLYNTDGHFMVFIPDVSGLRKNNLAMITECDATFNRTNLPGEEPVSNVIHFTVEDADPEMEYTINWKLDHTQVAGFDAATIHLVPVTFNAEGRPVWSKPVKDLHIAPFTGNSVMVSAKVKTGSYVLTAVKAVKKAVLTPVTNLEAKTGKASRSVVLQWTSPGKDLHYLLYMSAAPITADNLHEATEYPVHMLPAPAGKAEKLAVRVPVSNKLYYFILQTADNCGNVSGLSNVVSAIAPAKVETEPA